MTMASDLKVVVVDSDAIFAQSNPTDAHHDEALKINDKLATIKARVIYPSCIVLESTTMMHRYRKNESDETEIEIKMRQLAEGTLSLIAEPGMLIEPVDQGIIVGVAKYYDPKGSRDNTTFDCAIAAIAAKYQDEGYDVYIFSWDGFYEKNGFKLAKELLSPEEIQAA